MTDATLGALSAARTYSGKRAFDVAVGAVLFALAIPVLAVLALAIKLSSRGPVLFRQRRVGFDGRGFELIKLRTMHECSDEGLHRDYARRWIVHGEPYGESDDDSRDGSQDGSQDGSHDGSHDESHGKSETARAYKLTDDPRVYPLGRWLRRTGLDELPQLWNVLRGEMSLVGPRPALAYEVELYEPRHHERLRGLPGITGLWQVSGRNTVGFEAMVELDVRYLREWSLAHDIAIVLRTPAVMFASRVAAHRAE